MLNEVLDLSVQGVVWSPSKMIACMGKEINDPDSVYYWAYKVGHRSTACR